MAESDILSRCGYTIKQLINKKMVPENEAHQRIIDLTDGQIEAVSNVEKAWSKYLSKTVRKAPVKRCNLSDVVGDIDFSSDDFAYDD